MTKYRRERSVTAVIRQDGTVYFNAAKPLGERVLEWTTAGLWVLAIVVAVGAIF